MKTELNDMNTQIKGMLAGLASSFENSNQSVEDIANLFEIVKELKGMVDGFEQSLRNKSSDIQAWKDEIAETLTSLEDSLKTQRGVVETSFAAQNDNLDLKADIDHTHGDLADLQHSHAEYAEAEHRHSQLEKDIASYRDLKQFIDDLDRRLLQEAAARKKGDNSPHAKSHLLGSDQLPLATHKTRGLMSPTHVKKLAALKQTKSGQIVGPKAPDKGSNVRSFTWVVANPAIGGVPGPRIAENMLVTRVDGFVDAATSAAFNVEQRTSVGSSGTNILTSDLVATTTGAYSSSVTANQLIGGNYLWIDISAVTGTPTQLVITVTCSLK